MIGTPQYMAPEQIEAKPMDARTDIFALGVVLHEMLIGKPAFAGDTIPSLLSAILKDTPSRPSLIRADVPQALDRLIASCLAKDPNDRLQSAHDVMLQLRWIGESPEIPSIGPPIALKQPLRRRLAMAILGALGAAVIGGVSAWRLWPSEHSGITRLSFPLPDGQRISRPLHQFVAISPDGTRVVYVADGQLYLRSLSDLEAKPIPSTNAAAENPAFSPDGRSIVFGAVGERVLKRVGLIGGAATTICPAGPVYGLSWAADDSILFAQESGVRGILKVPASGGTPALVIGVKDDEEAQGPQLMPDRDHVLFTLATGTAAGRWDSADIVVQSLKSGERKTLVKGGTDARYLPSGHLVYGLRGRLFAAPFNSRQLELTGEPVPVVDGVRASGGLSGSMQFSVSNTGTLVYVPGADETPSDSSQLAYLDLKGALDPLKLPPGAYGHPRISPNGKYLAVEVSDGKGTDVWIYHLSGTSPLRRLTIGGRNTLPTWSPDSRRVAFQSDRDGNPAVFVQSADGTNAAERLTSPEPNTSHAPESWSPDGKYILFDVRKGLSVTLWSLFLSDGKVAPFGNVQSPDPTSAAFSPDGRWVAYATSADGQRALRVQPFPSTGAVCEIGPGVAPVWSPNGKELRWSAGNFFVANVTVQPVFGVSTPIQLSAQGMTSVSLAIQRNFEVAPDGRFFGFVSTQSRSPTPVTFQVVLNWVDALAASTAPH